MPLHNMVIDSYTILWVYEFEVNMFDELLILFIKIITNVLLKDEDGKLITSQIRNSQEGLK